MNWGRGIKRLYFFLWAVWAVYLGVLALVQAEGRVDILALLIFAFLIPGVVYIGARWIALIFRSGRDKSR